MILGPYLDSFGYTRKQIAYIRTIYCCCHCKKNSTFNLREPLLKFCIE